MSISFTPSQLHVIAYALTEAEFLAGDEYTSEHRFDLYEAFRAYCATGAVPRITAAMLQKFPGSQASHEAIVAWFKLDSTVESAFDSQVNLVSRAYARFRKEFVHYREGKGGLGMVRKYHALLLDTLVPFLSMK